MRSAGDDEMTSLPFLRKWLDIERMVSESYQHHFSTTDDFHCKSAEGARSIHLPPFYWSGNRDRRPEIEIFSYIFGDGRHHYFSDIDEALTEVRGWYIEEFGRRTTLWV